MKLAVLAPGNSIHTSRWVNALAQQGLEVILLSAHPFTESYEQVKCIRLPYEAPHGYLMNVPAVRRWLSRNRPAVLHAHYASGYGTLGRLAKWRPYVLSVWGSDVFDFPRTSGIARRLFLKNVQAASLVCSTSHCMADEIRRYAGNTCTIEITPFGIDELKFSPASSTHKKTKEFVVGTVKTLETTYGVDVLIKGFQRFRELLTADGNYAANSVRLVIAGDGSERRDLERLADRIGCAERTEFMGRLPHEKIAACLSQFDTYVAMSRAESFGVAVLEASACGLPVVVSNVGGLPEVVVSGKTGLIVPSENHESLARALLKLAQNEALREQLGIAGRQHVVDQYSWKRSVDQMMSVYARVMSLPQVA